MYVLVCVWYFHCVHILCVCVCMRMWLFVCACVRKRVWERESAHVHSNTLTHKYIFLPVVCLRERETERIHTYIHAHIQTNLSLCARLRANVGVWLRPMFMEYFGSKTEACYVCSYSIGIAAFCICSSLACKLTRMHTPALTCMYMQAITHKLVQAHRRTRTHTRKTQTEACPFFSAQVHDGRKEGKYGAEINLRADFMTVMRYNWHCKRPLQWFSILAIQSALLEIAQIMSVWCDLLGSSKIAQITSLVGAYPCWYDDWSRSGALRCWYHVDAEMLSCADLMSVRSKCVSNWRGETALCVRACEWICISSCVWLCACVLVRAYVRADVSCQRHLHGWRVGVLVWFHMCHRMACYCTCLVSCIRSSHHLLLDFGTKVDFWISAVKLGKRQNFLFIVQRLHADEIIANIFFGLVILMLVDQFTRLVL